MSHLQSQAWLGSWPFYWPCSLPHSCSWKCPGVEPGAFYQLLNLKGDNLWRKKRPGWWWDDHQQLWDSLDHWQYQALVHPSSRRCLVEAFLEVDDIAFQPWIEKKLSLIFNWKDVSVLSINTWLPSWTLWLYGGTSNSLLRSEKISH